MIPVDRNRVPSPLDPSLVARTRVRVRDWFTLPDDERRRRKPEFPERSEIREQALSALSELFYQKCAYCESSIDFKALDAVDWFRPPFEATDISGEGSIDHYIWLIPDWANLYFACMPCSRAKRSLFPVEGERATVFTPISEMPGVERALLIDPCREDPLQHLRFLETGEVEGISPKGEVTIRLLNLNRRELIEARSEAWIEVSPTHGSAADSTFSEMPFAAVRRAASAAAKSGRRVPTISQQRGTSQIANRDRRTAEEILSTDADAFRLTSRPLRRVHIRNFRVLREIEISFSEPGSERAPWLMLLGENATGKSTVLQAIGLALAGADEAALHTRPARVLSSGAVNGYVKVWFWDQDSPAELRFERGSEEFEGTKGASAIVLGYGALRYAERRSRQHDDRPSFTEIAPLIEPIARIRYPGSWLLYLDDDRFDTATRALQSVLPSEQKTIMHRSGGRLLFQVDDHQASVGELSAGYQTIVSICADIMRLLFARWQTLSSATAIVLIDEVDAHLHPRWSMRVVRSLREAFPFVQFVTSTHDPLALRGLRNGEVALLRRDENGMVVADQSLPSIEGLQVDQLLTSRVFGLNSTIDPETEALLDEFYYLLSLPVDAARDRRISEIRARVGDREALGRSEAEQLMFQAAQQYIRETAASPAARVALRDDTLARLRELAARGAATQESRNR
jgi:hypothetical protein